MFFRIMPEPRLEEFHTLKLSAEEQRAFFHA